MKPPAMPRDRRRPSRCPDATIAADFKHLAAAAPYFQPAHFQATFETGLEILLEGIRRARQGGG